LIRLFWKHFFALLLLAVAVAEWTCVAWLLVYLGDLHISLLSHAMAVLLIYLLNRRILARAPAPLGFRRTLRVAYTRFAFSSLFGFLLLLLVAASWSVARAGLHVAGFAETLGAVDTLGRVARALATGGLLLVAGSMAYAYAIGAGRLWINRFEAVVRHLPQSMDGLRVVQISDVHAGPFLPLEQLADYVERINRLEADLIVSHRGPDRLSRLCGERVCRARAVACALGRLRDSRQP